MGVSPQWRESGWGWDGRDWFEVTAVPDAVRRLAALVQQLNAQ